MTVHHALWFVALLLVGVASRLLTSGETPRVPPARTCRLWVQVGAETSPVRCLDHSRIAGLRRLRPGDRLRGAGAGPGAGERLPAPWIASLELPVDVNRAGTAELRTLPGIGTRLARRIVAERQRRGPFRRPEDLLRVRGIGPRLLGRIRRRLLLRLPLPTPGPSR